MKYLLTSLTAALVVLSVGCTDSSSHDRMKTVKMGDRELEVTIPTAVWKSVEGDYAAFNLQKKPGGEEEGGEAGGESEKEKPVAKKSAVSAADARKRLEINKQELDTLLKRRPPSDHFPFKVVLTEKTDGVLGKYNYTLDFPAGGGLLDLSRFVAENPIGSFYFKVSWDTKELPYKFTKVYFVSRSKEREVKGGKFGSGCNQFFDLTKYFTEQMDQGGMFLNTAHLRHVSLLTGVYYFLVFKDAKIHMARLEILDSRHKDLMCVPQ